MEKISWVQLSDLHTFNLSQWNTMQKKYVEKLKNRNIQFLIVSGDLHQINRKYDITIDFLNELVHELCLNKEDVFIIPGNHDCDIDAKEESEEISALICNRMKDDPDLYNTRKEKIIKKYNGYKKFLIEFYGDDLYKEYEKIVNGYNVFVWKNMLNILCINSTYICDGNNEHKQILDTMSLSKLSINNEYPLIACMHHYINDIFNEHKAILNSSLKRNMNSVLLCGDKHISGVEDMTHNFPNNFCCPCFIGYKSAYEAKDEYSELGFIIYNWDVKEKEVTCEFYKWDKNKLDFKEDENYKEDNNFAPKFSMKDRCAKTNTLKDDFEKEKKQKNNKSDESIPSLWSVTGETLISKVKNADLSKTNHLLKNMEKVLVDPDQASVLGFLNNKNLSFSFLLGLKGNGKTLCITLKRYILQRDGVICIPKNEVLSKKANFTITTDLMAGINLEDCSSNIQGFILRISHYWQTAIYLTILQTVHEFDSMKDFIKFEDNECYCGNIQLTIPSESNSDIKQILSNKKSYSPLEMMMLVLNWSQDTINNLNMDLKSVINIISKRFRQSNIRLAIFIDAIDQMTFDCNKKIPSHFANKMGEIFQIALLQNYDLFSSDIAMYITMRQEVFIAYKNDYNFRNVENMQGEIKLSYSKTNMEKLYRKYIYNDNPKYRYTSKIPKEYMENTDILSEYFVGTNEIENKNTKCKENLFNYLYRHTFRRARDLTKLCQRLTHNIETIRESKNTSVTVKATIDDYIKSDSFGYLKEYVNELFNESDCYGLFDEKFLSLIPSDILSYNQINILRGKYSELYKEEGVSDPFEVLYRLGLLGYFEKNELGEYVHKLIPVTSIRTISTKCTIDSLLPQNAGIYTIHTVLAKLISVYRRNFYYSKNLVINTNQTIDKTIYNKIKREIANITKKENYII